VRGNLTLDGILSITDSLPAGGSYLVMTYTGALNDQGVAISNVPPHFLAQIDTTHAGEVRIALHGVSGGVFTAR
jgi:hypothetical protein